MPQARVNGDISLEWESFGDRAAEPLVLVMGLGMQMVHWPDAFCRALADRGYFVVRFDNRDVGLSTKLDALGLPRIPLRFLARLARVRIPPPYSLSDMARDVVGLLDALDLPSAHFAGISMGGMISQTLAIEHPARVRSLVSIASSTSDHGLPLGTREALAVLTTPPPSERAAAIEHGVRALRTIGSPAHFDEALVRETVARSIDRSTYRLGAARHFAAILAAAPRTPLLRRVRVPATVIHGRLDPLLRLPHGEATARALPDARLLVIGTMGHDLPRALWPELIAAIDENARRAPHDQRASVPSRPSLGTS